jgi:hypothetical protein
MRRTFMLCTLALAALVFSASAMAKGPKPHPNPHANKGGPVTVVRDDNGSCGSKWATDTVKSDFKVKKNDDGSYRFTRRDRGTFVTTGPVSPGKCETKGKHGTAVAPGVKGKVHGFITGTVTGGTFNPNGCTPATCTNTPDTIAALFGPTAVFSCRTDSKDCKFDYEYSAPAKGKPALLYRHWSDKGKGAGTLLVEKFHGDIATA